MPTRARARELIIRGVVQVLGELAQKPAQMVTADAEIAMLDDSLRYVSRGALKLVAGLEAFALEVGGKVALDIGASTGGFSDVLLQAGARKVYAVDVGHDQLAEKLRADPRVVNLERVDARHLTTDMVPDAIQIIVSDVSFISLRKALPAALDLAEPGCSLVALIKPQFEVGPDKVGKGGVVRDRKAQDEACETIRAWLGDQSGWSLIDIVPSPIVGGAGNREFLLGARYVG